MPIPEFNEIKAPVLQRFASGEALGNAQLLGPLAEHFGLSDAERNELLPSGTETRWRNRLTWACYDLYRAGLLERVKKGTYRITAEGQALAASKPERIDRETLMRYPAFAEWMRKTAASRGEKLPRSSESAQPGGDDDRTPDEQIAAAHQVLHANLVAELRDLLAKMDPYRFEQLVVDLLVAMGYGGSREEAAQVTRAAGDEGIDGVINEDRLGLDIIYVQAKRWTQKNVGRPDIQGFVGALAGKQANKGVFITCGEIAKGARDYVAHLSQKVILIDGQRLAELMIEHDVGVSLRRVFTLKQIDTDYFESL